MEIKAYAKVNLSLKVLNKREDGYHNIETVLSSIDLTDTISIFPKERITVCSPQIPEEKNLAKKAALILCDYTGKRLSAKIVIEKKIPISAGLGGGSSDAAAVLLGLNSFWNLNLSEKELYNLAKRLGADVPYFLKGGTALGEGIGTELMPLRQIPDCFFVLVTFPDLKISTKNVYASFTSYTQYNIEPLLDAIEDGDLQKIAENLHNDLESVIFPRYPEVLCAKKALKKVGALGSVMSGSGPTVFGIAETEAEAERIREKMIGSGFSAIVAKPVR